MSHSSKAVPFGLAVLGSALPRESERQHWTRGSELVVCTRLRRRTAQWMSLMENQYAIRH